MGDDVKLNAYFERIGFSGSIAPTLQTLEALHALQPATIAFENFNSVLGLPVPLDQQSLNRKLLTERRGGYCFELNLMFMRVLRNLGFDVHGHLAKVMIGRRDAEGLSHDHMMMTVDVAGTTYLADVGFGGMLLTAPIRLETGIEQATAQETYRITGADPNLRLEVRRDGGEWAPHYEFSLTEVEDAQYEALNAELNADPEWFLRHHALLELCPPTGRRMLYDTRFTVVEGGVRNVHHLPGVPEMRDAVTTQFNMALPAVDGLDAAFASIITRGPGTD